ncbi:MAG: ester cyclase [Chloroflexota bacterium]
MIDLKDLTRRTWEQMLPAGDVDALIAVIDPDCINHDTPPGAAQGREGIRDTIAMLQAAFSDQHYEVHHVIEEGDMVVIHATLHARHTGPFMGIPPTGREIAFRSIHLVRYRDGREVETWAIQDRLGLRQQLGAIPERAAAS